MPRAPKVLIGIGNPYRRDDGIGPAAATVVDRRNLAGVDVVVADGEPASLLESWAGRDLAVVVDAVRCQPSTPGRIWRSTPDQLGAPSSAASSHALGIPDALLLGQVLGRVPARLVVLAVEAADLDLGVGLSPQIRAVLPAVVNAALAELTGKPAPMDRSR